MNIKSILLGTAAGLVAATGAQAADLPGEVVPVAVDYVKVCDTFGAGFFYIPGTETCLDISGRVRFRVSVGDGVSLEGTDPATNDGVQFRADARVDFDARTATEYGQLRSFFRIQSDGGNGAEVDSAFIQLGWLTVGYAGTPVDVSVLHGINDNTFYDFQTTQITILADDIGGGFYVGASIHDHTGGDTRVSFGQGAAGARGGTDDLPAISARIGIADQPWGGVDLSGSWIDETFWFAKLTATLQVVDALEVRLSGAYVSYDDVFTAVIDDGFYVGLSGYYNATDAVGVYAGVIYDDGAYNISTEERLFINAGVDYTVTPGLVLTGEVNYQDFDNDDNFTGILQLSRTW